MAAYDCAHENGGHTDSLGFQDSFAPNPALVAAYGPNIQHADHAYNYDSRSWNPGRVTPANCDDLTIVSERTSSQPALFNFWEYYEKIWFGKCMPYRVIASPFSTYVSNLTDRFFQNDSY